MTRIALACFEEQPNGSWICQRDTTVEGSRGYEVFVKRSRVFLLHTKFAGYDDFTAYLASQSETRADPTPPQGF